MRLHCGRCQRPERTCLCAWATPVANEVNVLILQHPLEVHQAKGSASLLRLNLQRCQLMVGETWDEPVLQQALSTPGPHGQALVNVLLYPDTHSAMQRGPSVAPALSVHNGPFEAVAKVADLRLVVLDGTWRKSLKMLHLNPALAALPRLALPAQAPSRYRIRKAHRPDQLSTLEATCLALSQLEEQPARYGPLLGAFDEFVSARCAFATRNRH